MFHSLRIGVCQKAAKTELVVGDVVRIVEDAPASRLLVAVADGLGHGPLARAAAETFCDHVAANAPRSLSHIMLGASDAVASTRGAAGAILALYPREGVLEFCGVGNVSIQSESRQPFGAFSVPGILGRKSRSPRTFRGSLSPADFLVVTSDGVATLRTLSRYSSLEAQLAADTIVAERGRGYDDATCVVVRVAS